MGEFSLELGLLRRGRGVMAGDVLARIGPLLRERAHIDESDEPRVVRDRLVAYLTGLAKTLPADLGLAFAVGLGVHPDARFQFLEQRMDWLGGQIGRDARTARRRFDEAVRLVEGGSGHIGEAALGNAVSVGRRVDYQVEFLFKVRSLPEESKVRVGFVTGDIRRVRSADIWVNPENTRMEMARYEEHSVSAVIRYEGARRDEAGKVVDDSIANELSDRLAGADLVAPGTVVTTGSGELLKSNNVRHIVHVAAVHGEPGEGYRRIRDLGRCVTNILAEADRLSRMDPAVRTILIPLLGAGTANADPEDVLRTMLGAALDRLSGSAGDIGNVLFLAYNDQDLAACRAVFEANPRLAAIVNCP